MSTTWNPLSIVAIRTCFARSHTFIFVKLLNISQKKKPHKNMGNNIEIVGGKMCLVMNILYVRTSCCCWPCANASFFCVGSLIYFVYLARKRKKSRNRNYSFFFKTPNATLQFFSSTWLCLWASFRWIDQRV